MNPMGSSEGGVWEGAHVSGDLWTRSHRLLAFLVDPVGGSAGPDTHSLVGVLRPG